jgi:hypothetical protein
MAGMTSIPYSTLKIQQRGTNFISLLILSHSKFLGKIPANIFRFHSAHSVIGLKPLKPFKPNQASPI